MVIPNSSNTMGNESIRKSKKCRLETEVRMYADKKKLNSLHGPFSDLYV